MFDKRSFVGKRILVTGASSGIGRSTAILLSRLGAKVVAIGRNIERLKDTILSMEGTDHSYISFDVCDFVQYNTVIQQCVFNGKLDGMVHCAGIAKPIPIKAVSPTAISEIMSTNFVSFIMLINLLGKKKFTNDGASFVAVSSVDAHYAAKAMSIYAASKAALEAAVRSLAGELYSRRKLRINTLVAGPIVTPMRSVVGEDDLSLIGMRAESCGNLMGLGSPDYVAQMAAFLLDNSSAYTTGRNFYVDGGYL